MMNTKYILIAGVLVALFGAGIYTTVHKPNTEAEKQEVSVATNTVKTIADTKVSESLSPAVSSTSTNTLPPKEKESAFVSKTSGTVPFHVTLTVPEFWMKFLKEKCDFGIGDFTGSAYSVDWGDGSRFPPDKTGCGLEHTYIVSGEYIIKARTYNFTDIRTRANNWGKTDTWTSEATVTVTQKAKSAFTHYDY